MNVQSNLHIGLAAGGPLSDSLRNCMEPRKGHPVARLAEYVDLVHLAWTREAPLKAEISQLYIKQVQANPDFVFTAAIGSRFTYDRDLDQAAVGAWKQGFMPMLRARRLASLTMQFPWSFKFTAENREHVIKLRRAFHEFPLSAEFRHESWMADEAISTLIDYHVSLANIDQPSYFRAMPPTAILTAGTAVVMMHGRMSADVLRGFDRHTNPAPYRYTTEEIEGWLGRVRRLSANATRTVVVYHNFDSRNAFVNALQTSEMMGVSRLKAPAGLIRRFPQELGAFRASRPVQHLLLPRYAPDTAVA